MLNRKILAVAALACGVGFSGETFADATLAEQSIYRIRTGSQRNA